jgi:NADH-quinone oxidoreductase subunit C
VTAPNPSAAALQQRFGDAVQRVAVSCGDTIVHVDRARAHDVLAWLKDDPGQRYDYLTDLTAVEYRDRERPLEMVYQLWSLERKAALRLKVELPKDRPLELPTVTDLWQGADWLEREVWDMFGIRFIGHPDLRRILMWETYAEGHPLRKDFPLRGRFSRSEQVRQALSADMEAHYSLEELSLPQAAPFLPGETRERLGGGGGTG